ncbi:MAG: hypothetical protein ACRCTR_05595 [Actinomycetota bacterium]
MFGLTVRWSLVDSAPGTADRLREYVVETSVARFAGRPDLAFKVWRMRSEEWFEGTYFWSHEAARDAFAAEFAATGAGNPGSELIGSAPVVIEPFEVVAVTEGAAGFTAVFHQPR